MIKINNIIDVNLKIATESSVIGSYSTLIYVIDPALTLTTTSNEVELPNYVDGTGVVKQVLCSNLADVKSVVTDEFVIANAELYFKAGGSKLLLLKPTANDSQLYDKESFMADLENARNVANDFIFVLFSRKTIPTTFSYAAIKDIADESEKISAPYTYRVLITTNDSSIAQTYNLTESLVGIKYSTKAYTSGDSAVYYDTAILIGAYFTKINLNGDSTIKDYCYTSEDFTVLSDGKQINLSENVSQSVYEKLVESPSTGYYNFIDTIGNRIVNFGGNYSKETGIAMNIDFGNICVENDISYGTLEAIVGKQYLTEQGLTNIVGAINSQLERYKSNGYLNQGSRYSGEDYSINYNGRSYKVIKKGTLLPSGYYIFTIPVSNISANDKQAKRFPPIYIIMETLAGARKVVITGEVR